MGGQRNQSAVRLARQLVVSAGVCVVVVGYRLSSLSPSRFAVLSLGCAVAVSLLVFASLTTTAMSILSSVSIAQMASVLSFFGVLALAAGWWAVRFRKLPSVRFPEHPEDVASAVHWTVENIHRHGGDPGCLILAGHSAGAHLVSLVSLDTQYLDPKVKVRGLAAISGLYHPEMRVPGSGVLGSLWRFAVQTVWQVRPQPPQSAVLRVVRRKCC